MPGGKLEECAMSEDKIVGWAQWFEGGQFDRVSFGELHKTSECRRVLALSERGRGRLMKLDGPVVGLLPRCPVCWGKSDRRR